MIRHVRFRGGVLLQTNPVKIRFFGSGTTSIKLSHAGWGNPQQQVSYDGGTADVVLEIPGAWPGAPEPQPGGTVPTGTPPAMQPGTEVTFPAATAVRYEAGTQKFLIVICDSTAGLTWGGGMGRLSGPIDGFEYLDWTSDEDPTGNPVKP